MQISKLAHIHPDTIIGEGTTIDAFAVIHENVTIGANCYIASNVVIYPGVTIGDNCKFFPGAVIGAIPQDLKYNGEETFVSIGNNVIIREYCTVNKGTKAYGKTVIGDHSLLMAYVHVAHDCHIHDHCIIANSVNFAGHVVVGAYVYIGGMSAVQQFVNIGSHAYIAGASLVRKDVPPYVKAAREPISYVGINRIGLERRGFSTDSIARIQELYRVLYVKGWNTAKSLEHIRNEIPDSIEKNEVLTFVDSSEKGLMRGFNSLSESN